MKTARHHSRVVNVLVALALVLGLSLTAAVPASANVSAATVSVVPTSVNSAARYTVNFNVGGGGALVANVDSINVTFPTGTTVPVVIPTNTVIVNGVVIDNVVNPAPVVVGRSIIVTAPVSVSSSGAVSIVFTQNAGILNPGRATTTAKVSVSTSAEPSLVNSANYTINPTLTLSPTSGPRGTVVTVTGAGYGASLGVDIRNASAANAILASTVSDANGNINTSLTIPNNSPSGNNALQAIDGAGFMSPTATFTVTPTFSVSPISGYQGSTVQLIGSAWPANSTVSAATVGGVSVVGTVSGPARVLEWGAFVGLTVTTASSTHLIDSETNFLWGEVAVGDLVVNVSDGSAGPVTAVTNATDLAVTLAGNVDGVTPNTFALGDVYKVLSPQTSATGTIVSLAGGQWANVTLQIPQNAAPGVKTASVTTGWATATTSF